MSEQARALGLPGEIVFEGKTLRVQRRTCDIEATFTLWLENNLTRALERSRAVSSLAVYQDRLKAANEQLALRAFDPGEPAFEAAALSTVGFKELSFLCVQSLQPQWTRADHDRLWQVPGTETTPSKAQELFNLIDRISRPLPNGPAPESGASGAST